MGFRSVGVARSIDREGGTYRRPERSIDRTSVPRVTARWLAHCLSHALSYFEETIHDVLTHHAEKVSLLADKPFQF